MSDEPLLLVALILTAIAGGLVSVALLPTLYLGALAVFAWPHPKMQPKERNVRFRFVVPAHNERDNIAATVKSLLAVDWPRDKFDVVVVADNCSDDTAQVARDAGATVYERVHDTLRGKGYALEYAFERVLKETDSDAICFIDADTVASTNLLEAFAARIEAGALAVQPENNVLNVHASWRTQLMKLALSMFHTLRNNARERLGVSVGLRGNGMCLTRTSLERFPHKAHGLVEDVEHGLALGRGGIRVVAAPEGSVLSEMLSDAKASESQRRRWEGGRDEVKKALLPGLLRDVLRVRSRILLDLAFDLMTPPLSSIAVLVAVASAVGVARVVVCHVAGLAPDLFTFIIPLPVLLLSLYVLRGMQLSGLGLQAVVVMAKAPAYVLWKLSLKLRGSNKSAGWVRTTRESELSKKDERTD